MHAHRRPIEHSGELGDLLLAADQMRRHGEREQALALLLHARTVQAPDIERYAVGEALLRASNGRLGWDLYDLHPSRPVDRLPGVHRWDGRRCRLLIVLAEQGFGDAIQFLRFVPLAAAHAKSVVVAVHDELLDVVSSSPVLDGCTIMSKSTARQTAWPPEARWERMMSLPARTTGWEVRPDKPYLQAVATSTPTLTPVPQGCLTIGVAWRSTPRRGFPNRSIPARLVGRLVVPGRTRVVPLHRSQDLNSVPNGMTKVPIGNFAETARVISQCDYVVTSDTVTAHLAPALGTPTLICLRHRPDWRWGTPQHATRWYARAELLFQDESEAWAPVLSTAVRRILGDAQGALPVMVGG